VGPHHPGGPAWRCPFRPSAGTRRRRRKDAVYGGRELGRSRRRRSIGRPISSQLLRGGLTRSP
jgi:hypothetical protein